MIACVPEGRTAEADLIAPAAAEPKVSGFGKDVAPAGLADAPGSARPRWRRVPLRCAPGGAVGPCFAAVDRANISQTDAVIGSRLAVCHATRRGLGGAREMDEPPVPAPVEPASFADREAMDLALDTALDQSFPASDPPSMLRAHPKSRAGVQPRR